MAKKVKKSTKANPPAKATKKKGGKYTGTTTGLGVAAFQNKTILDNPKKSNRLTDKQLAKLWRDEFPEAVRFTEAIVASVRNVVNRGKHNNEAPAKAVLAYDKHGNAIPVGPSKAATSKGKAKPTKKKTKKAVIDEDDDDDLDDLDDLEDDDDE